MISTAAIPRIEDVIDDELQLDAGEFSMDEVVKGRARRCCEQGDDNAGDEWNGELAQCVNDGGSSQR